MLKPYYIKMNAEYIKVILAYQYFSLFIDKQVYHFVPIEGQEILINRKTKRVVNTETKFAFQKDKEVLYITVKKLTTLADFMNQLEAIIKPYYEAETQVQTKQVVNKEIEALFEALEKDNVKRLIDQSLDEKNQAMFHELSSHL